MEKLKLYIKKTAIYSLGLFIMAFGVSVSALSSLGVSPVNSIPYVLNGITGIGLDICVTAVLCLYVLIQFLILRKEFKIINVLQILCSTMFGVFVGFTNDFVSTIFPQPANYFVSLIMLFASIVLVAGGLIFYLNGDIMLLPCEGIMKVISSKTSLKPSSVKIMLDVSFVVTATVLSLVFLGKMEIVREGTAIAAFGVGATMKILEKFMKEPINVFLYGKVEAE